MRSSAIAIGYGYAWGGDWNVRIIDQGSDGFLAVRGNASQYLFTGTGQMTAYRSGHKNSLLDSDPTEGNRPRFTDGSGKQEFYQNSGNTRLLEEVRWPDGYSIFLTYNASDQLIELDDTKGQVAQFTWDDTLNAAYTVPVIKKIEVDTDYDSVTFAPELSINYTYATPSFFIDQLSLSSVSRTDIATAQTETIWEYGYSANKLLGAPIKLISMRDGRLDAGGLPFDFASWTYENVDGGSYTGRAIQSQHFGGDGVVDLTFNAGNSVTQTNALGKDTITDFALVAGRYRPTSVTGIATASCLGTSKSVSYVPGVGEPEGYVYERIERNGSRTTYTRDSRGLVLTKTEDTDGAAPRTTTYTWDAILRLPLTRSTSQMVESFNYSPSGLLLQYSQTDVLIESPDSGKVRTWTYSYTTLASGLHVLTEIDGPGVYFDAPPGSPNAPVLDITTYTYDTNGNMTSETDPNGHTTQYLNLNAAGQPTLVIHPDSIEWAYTYDIVGRVTSATRDPSGAAQTINLAYDVTGQLISYSNFIGDIWSFEYNEAKRLVKTTDPMGGTASYAYDALGDITNVSYSAGANPASFYEDMQYDALGRILQATGANGQISSFSHDVEDNLATITDPLANQNTYAYDGLNRITSTIDRAGNTSLQTFDDADQRTRFTDPRSIETAFYYNGFGELVIELSADRGSISYSYNDRGLTSSMTDARGITSTYEYDDGGRLTAHRFPSNPSEDQTFTYDLTGGSPFNVGKLSRTNDETGLTRVRRAPTGEIKYVRTRIDGINYLSRYWLNAADQRVWTQYPSKRRIYYNYNDAENLTRLRTRIQIKVNGSYPAWAVVVQNATYLPLGPLNSLRYGDNYTHTASYDTSYRLTGLADANGPTTLRDVTLGYSARDNIISITDALDALRNEGYQYSARELLSNATGPWDTLDYTYDAVGNRTLKTETIGASINGQYYAYPLTSNRLETISEAQTPVHSFTYDSAGNVISEDRLGDIYTYTYNAANRMSSMSLNGVLQAEYKYNALGQQAWRKLRPTGQTLTWPIIHSIFDLEGNRIAEYDYDSVAGASTLLREYIWMDGLPVAVVENDVVYYVRTDHIGRPVFATDSASVKVWEATYYPFGEVLATTGTPIALRFPGQWFQSESGLHQNWMRDYDPTTGRYLQADPLGLVDGASVYGYVRQNPGRYVDPTGELLKPDGGRSVGFGWPIVRPPGYYWPMLDRALLSRIGRAVAAAAASGRNTIPWPEKNKRNYSCICRAHRDGRSEQNCPDGPLYGWGYGISPNLRDAWRIAKDMAHANLAAASSHHTQCKCTGPNGEQIPSGRGIP
ncbi:MAG: RHS repeat protein [Rhodobacteraceae bacterium]|nr:RHS repeat protein [Paracoccaceae bacterium]